MMHDIATPPPDGPALRADPLADAAIGAILGPSMADGPDLALIALVNRELARWDSNAALDGWRAGVDLPPHVAAALEGYVAAARALPAWADPARIARAEQLFVDLSMASCTLLFCASLPQCYVVPDLAAVLHVAGQLEQHTDYRVRSTAAMIFPVMMRGGLRAGSGGGVAQALKVRLIHATIRHLILRGEPGAHGPAPALPALPALTPLGAGMHQALYAHGWDPARLGLPCNQEELAYTLLTFGYVFLQGLRRLGIGLPAADEEAYLHTWNVLGHLLGIERGLMPDTMNGARALFEAIQSRNRPARQPDPRPALARALVGNLERYIPPRLLKPFPLLLTRYLCGRTAARALGLDGAVGWAPRMAFTLAMSVLRAIDAVGRRFAPGFSLSRLGTRILGYHFTVQLLMDQTRPLKLPDALLGQVGDVVRSWHDDPRAPRWVNAAERRFTGRAAGPVTKG
jgi:hypothetical protein